MTKRVICIGNFGLEEKPTCPECPKPQSEIPVWCPPPSDCPCEGVNADGSVPWSIPDFSEQTIPWLSSLAFTEQDADPIIREHAIHWLVCIETYRDHRNRHIGQNVDWELIDQDYQTCIYRKGRNAIIGFRGTKVSKDLYDDTKLSMGQVFPRAALAISYINNFSKANPTLVIELTGHSLGGAVARVAGATLPLKVITFNAAAPPSAPVVTGVNEVDYHVVFDIISAWQSPDTVRIDKGFNPIPPLYAVAISKYTWLYFAFADIYSSHALDNFSKNRIGVVIAATDENRLMQRWFNSLPSSTRTWVLWYLFGLSGSMRTSLPTLYD